MTTQPERRGAEHKLPTGISSFDIIAEGAFTAPVLRRAAEAAGVDMPIVGAVCARLSGEVSVEEVVERLLARPLRSEGV